MESLSCLAHRGGAAGRNLASTARRTLLKRLHLFFIFCCTAILPHFDIKPILFLSCTLQSILPSWAHSFLTRRGTSFIHIPYNPDTTKTSNNSDAVFQTTAGFGAWGNDPRMVHDHPRVTYHLKRHLQNRYLSNPKGLKHSPKHFLRETFSLTFKCE